MNAPLNPRPLSALFPPARLGWSLALAGCILLVGLAALPPWLPPRAAALVHDGYAVLCHQLPGRSAHAHGVAFALCHRCFGIGAGVLSGVLAAPVVFALAPSRWAWLRRRAGWAIGAALVPLVLDWTLGATGFWANTPLSRTLTGALFGLAAGAVLALGTGIGDASSRAEVPQQNVPGPYSA